MRVCSFLLLAIGLLSTIAHGESDSKQASSLAPARRQALDVLQSALAAEQEGHSPGIDRLRNSLRDAARLVDGNVLVNEAIQSALEKADRAADDAQAIVILEGGVREASEILAFQPFMEAKLPKGFPRPTPLGEIAVKNYPAYRAARTDMNGESRAFWRLFEHITTNEIAMSAPVEVTYSGPAEAADARIERESMAFLYGDTNLGKPGVDHTVSVADFPPARYVSIGMRGDWNSQAIAAARKHLLHWINTHSDEYKIAGNLRMMGYNSPMIPVAKRYFEVELPIEPLRREANKANVDKDSDSR